MLIKIKKCKYFSLIIDSTPDITHIDQLSFIVRYVFEGIPVERFIKFIPSCGHKANDMKKAILNTLESLDISINDCRGKTYDTTNNMSGRYNGLQAKIKELNPLAIYIPCAAHSLNLVGTHAVQCSNKASQFFLEIQHLNTLILSGSTHRWKVLMFNLKSESKTLKRLSGTRWSSRDDACVSLNDSWDEILKTLSLIENDNSEPSKTQNEAYGLRKRFEKLETTFMAIF